MSEIKFKEILKARNQCAKIIAQYGDRYLPIFERLQEEIDTRKKQQILFEKAIAISNEIGTPNGTQNGTQIKE